MNWAKRTLGLLLLTAICLPSIATEVSDSTQKANQAVRDYLPFDDNTNFKNAERGFIATITAHPANIQVSLATRQAIDDKRIIDIPREIRESRYGALADIEKNFHAFGMTATHQDSSSTPVFSIYLTESDH